MSSRTYDKLNPDLALFFTRRMAVERLREKHGLTPAQIVEVGAKAISERVAAYQEDLEDLQQQWRVSDAAKAESQSEAQVLEKRGKAR